MAEMFDIAETRKSLMSQRVMLQDEKEANIRLLQRFQQIASQLKSGNVGHGASQPPLSDEEEEDFDQSYQEQSYDSYESQNITPEMPDVSLQPERPSQSSMNPPPATPSSPRRQTPNKRSPPPAAPRPTGSTLNQADMNELDDLYSTSFTSDATSAPPKKANNNNSNNRNVNNNNRPRNTKNNSNNSNGNINNKNPNNSENNRKDE